MSKPVFFTRTKFDSEIVRATMAVRGLTTLDPIAQECAMSTRSLATRLTEGLRDVTLCCKIEKYFGYDVSLGSDSRLLLMRRRLFAAQKIDPWTLKKPDIEQFCERMNVRDWRTAKTTATLLEKIAAHLFANPSILKNTDESN